MDSAAGRWLFFTANLRIINIMASISESECGSLRSGMWQPFWCYTQGALALMACSSQFNIIGSKFRMRRIRNNSIYCEYNNALSCCSDVTSWGKERRYSALNVASAIMTRGTTVPTIPITIETWIFSAFRSFYFNHLCCIHSNVLMHILAGVESWRIFRYNASAIRCGCQRTMRTPTQSPHIALANF